LIPYFHIPALQLGPVTIYPFGILAALAVISGIWYSYRIAAREFHSGETLLDMAPWFLFFGFISAHVASIIFYFPGALHQQGYWTLLNFTSGLSSFGGLFGGVLGAYIFIHRHRLPLLPWLDVLARGFSLAYVFGRTGCSIAHDHPGLPTTFFLAMDYPARDGFPAGPRHDLGFYDLLFWFVLFLMFRRLGRRRRPDGFYLGLMILAYCPIRFGLDFLRTNDLAYFALTFAQWSCIATLPAGIWLLWRAVSRPYFSYPPPENGEVSQSDLQSKIKR